MSDHPILMSAPMIRALLAGTKTQTRRVVKARADKDLGPRCVLQPHELAGEVNGGNYRNAYCAPGDLLWCRETYRLDAQFDSLAPRDVPANSPYFMEASRSRWEGGPHDGIPGKLRPAIHMPRWVSRITLEVTGVRVERLQDISEADAMSEGAPPSHPSIDRISREYGYPDFPRSWYAQLWDHINGPGSWESNPWVFVVSFKRVTP